MGITNKDIADFRSMNVDLKSLSTTHFLPLTSHWFQPFPSLYIHTSAFIPSLALNCPYPVTPAGI